MTNACLPRSKENYLGVVNARRVESDPKYQRRDVDGDGWPETWCNLFVHDCTTDLECAIPFRKATKQIEWLLSLEGAREGWRECTEAEAIAAAAKGLPTVAFWKNPDPEKHSHVAMVVPGVEGKVFIAQAGRTNFSNAPLSKGFGAITPIRYATHA